MTAGMDIRAGGNAESFQPMVAAPDPPRGLGNGEFAFLRMADSVYGLVSPDHGYVGQGVKVLTMA